MEEWKPIPGYPSYEASTEGRIRRVGKSVLKPFFGTRDCDYPYVQPSESGKVTHAFVHVLVARAFLGERPDGFQCNHKDGNKGNARLSNLEYVTRSENQRHKHDVLGHRVNQGSKHGMSKLHETDINRIRALLAKGVRGRAIALEFHCSAATISMIANNRTWRHVPVLSR